MSLRHASRQSDRDVRMLDSHPQQQQQQQQQPPPPPHAPPPHPHHPNGALPGTPGGMSNSSGHGHPASQMSPNVAATVVPNGTMMVHPTIQKLDKANEDTWLMIGNVAEQMGDLERALSAYENALRHNPMSLDGLTQVASISRIRENYPKAVDYFQRVLNLTEGNGEVWSALGHCFLMQDDLQKAYSAYQQALYLLPNPKEDARLWYGIGILYDRYGSLDHAEEAFTSVLAMDKNFDKANEILFRLGIIYKQQAKYEDSLRCFDQILRNPPSPLAHADIWFQIGHVYEQQKDHPSAKDAYERVVADNPTHAKVLQQLGWLYHEDGSSFQNQDLAIQHLTKSLEADPSDAQSWYLLGRAYMACQKYNKAYEAYQQAVYRDGRNPTFWCSIGVLYFQINQYRDALDAYSRAIRINPYISEVWFDLGSLYESCNNQISDAIDAYARASELDPGNPLITQRLQLLKTAQATGGQLPAAPGPQDVHPTAYANTVVPPPNLGGPPMLLHNGPTPRPIFNRSNSRGPVPDGHLALPPPPQPSARPHSPSGPFRGGPPPPVILDETRSNRMPPHTPLAPMDIDRPVHSRNGQTLVLHHPIPQQVPPEPMHTPAPHPPQHPRDGSDRDRYFARPVRMPSTSVSPPPSAIRTRSPPPVSQVQMPPFPPYPQAPSQSSSSSRPHTGPGQHPGGPLPTSMSMPMSIPPPHAHAHAHSHAHINSHSHSHPHSRGSPPSPGEKDWERERRMHGDRDRDRDRDRDQRERDRDHHRDPHTLRHRDESQSRGGPIPQQPLPTHPHHYASRGASPPSIPLPRRMSPPPLSLPRGRSPPLPHRREMQHSNEGTPVLPQRGLSRQSQRWGGGAIDPQSQVPSHPAHSLPRPPSIAHDVPSGRYDPIGDRRDASRPQQQQQREREVAMEQERDQREREYRQDSRYVASSPASRTGPSSHHVGGSVRGSESPHPIQQQQQQQVTEQKDRRRRAPKEKEQQENNYVHQQLSLPPSTPIQQEPAKKERKKRAALKRGAKDEQQGFQTIEYGKPPSGASSGPAQHSGQAATFKVSSYGAPSSGTPEPLPSSAGSGSGSRSAQPSPPSAGLPPPPSRVSRVVDEDYDEGVADALMGLASYRAPEQPDASVSNGSGGTLGSPTGSATGSGNGSRKQPSPPRALVTHRSSISSSGSRRSPPGSANPLKRPLSPGSDEMEDTKRSRVEILNRRQSASSGRRTPSSRPSPIPFLRQPASHSPEARQPLDNRQRETSPPLQISLPPHPQPTGVSGSSASTLHPNNNAPITLPPIATLSPTSSSTSPVMEDDRMHVESTHSPSPPPSATTTTSRLKLSEVMHPNNNDPRPPTISPPRAATSSQSPTVEKGESAAAAVAAPSTS